MDGGHKSVGVGLCNYRTLKAHHNPKVMRKTDTYMDPDHSHMHSIVDRIGQVVNQHLKVFTIETVLNNRMNGKPLDMLARNEDHFTDGDWLKFDALRYSLKKIPTAAKRKAFFAVPAAYDVIAVNAGETEATHARTLEKCFEQYNVELSGQADVVITGIPFVSPYNVNSVLNPLLVQVMGLGYFHNMNKGGTLILTHPCYDKFDAEHHPSYIEFINRLLPETRDALTLHRKYEAEFAENPSYINKFRFGNAYHGAHPFFMWYWGEAGRRWTGRVIAAGADNSRVPALLGWERAANLQEAIAMARSGLNHNPSITMLHHPPIFVADVK